jgi:cation diffusion facilitator CzcD-associated flavoprotein CzcO
MEGSHGGAAVEVDVVVAGAGFGGLYAIHKLRNELGLRVQAFEEGEGVGGTWYWNTYPGARSDVEVTAYCYSFDRQLYSDWRWSSRYPGQPEILAYLNEVADRFDLKRSIEFGTSIVRASFNEERRRWEILTSKGEELSAQFLVEGIGILSTTRAPEIPHQDEFKGDVYHTARWPREGADFAGKRVGIIGNGSSGVQVIADVARQAEHLTVFQRTPQYVVPARNGPLDESVREGIVADYEGFRRRIRESVGAHGFESNPAPAMSVSEEEREAEFQRAWDGGGALHFMLGTFGDIITDRAANDAAAAFIRRKIAEIVDDPDVRDKLTPRGLYARRPICCDNYYEAFNRANVKLVDVTADPITEFTPRGLSTQSESHPLDVVIFATGFDAVTGTYRRVEHRGRAGTSLTDKWADRPRTYLGVMPAGFPNLFMLAGPMGPATNNPPMLEAEVDWIADLITYMRGHSIDAVSPRAEVESEWIELCDRLGYETLFVKVRSWMTGDGLPGKAPVMFYMGTFEDYEDKLRFAAEHLETQFDVSRRGREPSSPSTAPGMR